MRICYFDEVKPSPQGQPFYWLGGLMLQDDVIHGLEEELRRLAHDCFGTYELTQQTEFHATDICTGNGCFRRWRIPERRLDVLKELARIIDKPEGVSRVSVRLDISRIDRSVDHEAMAFMFLVEKVNDFARAKGTNALLIGDLEHERVVSRSVRNLAEFRQNGTRYAFGRRIENVLDTVHFAHSHHSRLLQLADAHMWFKQLLNRTDEPSGIKIELIRHLRQHTDITWDHKYKYWPA
jgi:hypothetical protein